MVGGGGGGGASSSSRFYDYYLHLPQAAAAAANVPWVLSAAQARPVGRLTTGSNACFVATYYKCHTSAHSATQYNDIILL